MRKVTKPCLPNEEQCILTEGIDYFKTGKVSIWGTGDEDMLKVLEKIELRGKWLNLAAGDGRYNLELLQKVDSLIVSDIDESALSKLWHNTPEEYRKKLKTKVFDITKKFPFKDASFDGVFATGILHLLPKEVLNKVVAEMDRVLRPGGRIVFELAADIKRITPEGKMVTFSREPSYSFDEAKQVCNELFKNYERQMFETKVMESFEAANPAYTFSCKFIILVGDKK